MLDPIPIAAARSLKDWWGVIAIDIEMDIKSLQFELRAMIPWRFAFLESAQHSLRPELDGESLTLGEKAGCMVFRDYPRMRMDPAEKFLFFTNCRISSDFGATLKIESTRIFVLRVATISTTTRLKHGVCGIVYLLSLTGTLRGSANLSISLRGIVSNFYSISMFWLKNYGDTCFFQIYFAIKGKMISIELLSVFIDIPGGAVKSGSMPFVDMRETRMIEVRLAVINPDSRC
ncbi:hypothetical protein AAB988_25595 [Burkholderia contaminans]|uniref:hypothetical protein n=1 Tax=Burkholderia contaminans TaxID=488447 RepID=UPI0031153334